MERWLLPGAAMLVLLAGFAAPMALELVALVLIAAALMRRRLSRVGKESAHD